VKPRLDRWMVDHAITESREKAQALIMAGDVLLNGQKAVKPGQPVPDGSHVQLLPQQRYVSRGGLKLEAALAHFGIDPANRICADFGSSTGGFTDCLLRAGAARVYAIDAGTNQLDWKLRADPRVIVHEGVNARHLDPALIPEPIAIAVCDVSFISATLILPAIFRALEPDTGRIVVLIKPQFEVGKGRVGKGGIVRDAALHLEACDRIRRFVEDGGFRTDIMESPITGAEGNKEFLLYGRK